jgi:hypothetical protein
MCRRIFHHDDGENVARLVEERRRLLRLRDGGDGVSLGWRIDTYFLVVRFELVEYMQWMKA